MSAGLLVTWTMLGAVVGGPIFGTMSDHLGWVKVLTWTILIFAVFTGLCALARGYWDLVAYRGAGVNWSTPPFADANYTIVATWVDSCATPCLSQVFVSISAKLPGSFQFNVTSTDGQTHKGEGDIIAVHD